MGSLSAVSSWSEIPYDPDAPVDGGSGGDPFYAVMAVIACGLLALVLFPPAELSVQVRLDQAPVGAVVRATLIPARVEEGAPPDRPIRQSACGLLKRTCRLGFRWPKPDRPLLPEQHTLHLALAAGGAESELGAVQIAAPRWGDVVRVVCTAGQGCQAP
jgi:hypothetical protein